MEEAVAQSRDVFLSVGKAHRNRRESRGVHEGRTWPGYVYKFPFSTLPDPLCPAIRLSSVFDGRLMFKAGENVPIRNRTSADSSRPFLWMADTRSRLAPACLSRQPSRYLTAFRGVTWFQVQRPILLSTDIYSSLFERGIFLFQKFSKFSLHALRQIYSKLILKRSGRNERKETIEIYVEGNAYLFINLL